MIRNKKDKWLVLLSICCFSILSTETGAGESIYDIHLEDQTDSKLALEELLILEEISRIQHKIVLIRPKIDQQLADEIATSIYTHCKDTNEDSDLILAIISVESWFNPKATSPAGARGLMQIMPLWIPECGDDLYNIDNNIRCGIKVYQTYAKMFKLTDMTLTAYNRGPSAIRRDRREGRDPRTSYARSIIKRYKKIKNANLNTTHLALL